MKKAITLHNVSVHYGDRQALQNVSGVFHQGSLTAVAGPNGSGKSTLLKAIAGVIAPASGEISFADRTKTRHCLSAASLALATRFSDHGRGSRRYRLLSQNRRNPKHWPLIITTWRKKHYMMLGCRVIRTAP